MSKIRGSYVLGTLTAIGLVVLLAFVLVLSRSPTPSGAPVSATRLSSVQKSLQKGGLVAFGTVTDASGNAVKDATALLTLVNDEGEVISRIQFPVRQGIFEIQPRDLPSLPAVAAGAIAAEAPYRLAEKVNVTLERISNQPVAGTSTERTRITPSRIHLELTPYNPWTTLAVLLPAILGLIFALLHLTHFARGMWVTYWYATVTGLVWATIIIALLWRYVQGEEALIPLFWKDLFVSIGVVIFAFLGSVIYVAFSMHEKPEGFFFDADQALRRKVLLTVTGRVLVAPYIALVAYGIFAATFPNLRTGAFAAFFGFFTGLFIKVVLDALNDIGLRFLSVEAREKVAARMAQVEVSEAISQPVADARLLLPEPAFLEAVALARQELLQKAGVLGVAPGALASVGQTSRRIEVYVREKKVLPPTDPNYVPPTYQGYRTDVVALPPSGPDEICRPINAKLSWKKIHQENTLRLQTLGAVQGVIAGQVTGTDVILLQDKDQTLFDSSAGEYSVFDAVGAHAAVASILNDRFDFVAFAIHRDSGLPKIGDYHIPVFNNIPGLGYEREGNPGSMAERDAWNSPRLRACFVRSLTSPFSTYRYLHEFGHYWCAYVTFRDSARGIAHSPELLDFQNPVQGMYHWGERFDSENSPIDHNPKRWIQVGPQRFEKVTTAQTFQYCPLDLYLMGLIPASQVGSIRILSGLTLTGETNPVSRNPIYAAQAVDISIQDVILSSQERQTTTLEPRSPFHLAFIVVSRDSTMGSTFAHELDSFRRQFESDFRVATRGHGELRTTL